MVGGVGVGLDAIWWNGNQARDYWFLVKSYGGFWWGVPWLFPLESVMVLCCSDEILFTP